MSEYFASITSILIFITMLIVGTSASAEPYFQDCQKAFKDHNFVALKNFWSISSQASEPVDEPLQCLKINKNKFLVVDLIQDQNHFGGVLLCNTEQRKCKSYLDSKPFLNIVKEFNEEDGMHFVLLGFGNMEHGSYDTGYAVLVFKSAKNQFHFHAQELVETSGMDDRDLCGDPKNQNVTEDHWNGAIATGFIDPNYQIDRKNLSLIFNLVEQDCSTRQTVNIQKKFVYRHGRFVSNS